MPKTTLKNKYLNRIDKLNDQLWYFLFSNEELNAKIATFSARAQRGFTTDLFSSNPYSPRIHIPVNTIADQQASSQQHTFGAYFSTAYEMCANYLADLYELVRTINRLTNPTQPVNTPEARLERLLTRNGIPPAPIRVFRTISYLRLRRNHFTHLLTTAGNALSDLVRDHGVNLNNDWVVPGTVTGINFTSLAHPDRFDQNTAIQFFKMLRICIQELDGHIASNLNADGIAEFVTRYLFGDQHIRTNLIVREQRTQSVINGSRRLFQRVITEQDCAPYVGTIGVR